MKYTKIIVPALCLFFLAGSVSCSSEDGKQTQQPVGEEVPVVTETPEEPQPVQETQAVQDVAPVIEETEDGTIDNTEPTDPSAVAVELSGVVGDRTTFAPSGPGSATQTSNTNPSLFEVSDDGAVSTIVLPLENTDDQVPARLAGPFAVTGNGDYLMEGSAPAAMNGVEYWATVDVATNARAMFEGFGYSYGDAIYTMGSDAVIVLVSDFEGTLTFNIFKGDGSEPIQFSSDQDRSSITIQVAPAAAVAEVEEEAEITFPVEIKVTQNFCGPVDSDDCWDRSERVPNFYACEDNTDAAFLADNCTLENIEVLVNKECGKIANSARPMSYQSYVVFNPSDTVVILNVDDSTGNYWGAHSDAEINPGSWVGHNFQHNLYNGETYDIRGVVTLEDGTLVGEFPIYTQTKNC